MKRKTYVLFAVVAILFLVAGFFTDKESIIDVNVYDTYFVVAHRILFWLFAIVLFFLFAIYWCLEKAKMELVNMLLIIHVFGSLGSILGIVFPYSLIFDSSRFPVYDDLQYINVCITINVLLFLFFQLLFIINIFVSLIRYIDRKKS